MANSKISELNALAGANTAADDLFAIVDTSASETKKITRAELVNALELGVFDAVQITGGTINGAVIGGSTAAAITGTAVVANTSVNIAGDGATVTGIKDEDDMASNSAVKLATQQSIKAYVDAQVATVPTGDITAVTAGTGLSGGGSSGDVTVTIDSTVATLTGSQTLTNKTMTSPVLNTGISGTAFLDEDNMSSNSATKVASQQSIKAYVDAQVATVPTGDITSVVAGTGLTGGGTSGDVTLNVIGGTGIDANANDVAIDSTVTTLTGSQTLTNKTLTSAVLDGTISGTSIKDEDNMSSNSASHLATQQSIKAYVDSQSSGAVTAGFAIAMAVAL